MEIFKNKIVSQRPLDNHYNCRNSNLQFRFIGGWCATILQQQASLYTSPSLARCESESESETEHEARVTRSPAPRPPAVLSVGQYSRAHAPQVGLRCTRPIVSVHSALLQLHFYVTMKTHCRFL